MTEQNAEKPTPEDARTLANAFVKRMEWPSMHWRTTSLDPEVALALALVALHHAPDIIAAARVKADAMNRALTTEATK